MARDDQPLADISGGIPRPPIPSTDDGFDITRLKRMFDDARTTLQDSRVDSELSRDYYDGPRQLSPAMVEILSARNQPQIWTNRIRPAVDGIVGVLDSNHTDPRAYPREPDDEEAADVASDVLRYTAEMNHFDVIKADCLENGLIEGCYAAIIEGAPDADVTVTQVRWDEFFYDPRSRRADFLDARYLGIAKWMYADQAAEIFPGKETELLAFNATGDAGAGVGVGDETWQDKPVDAVLPWVDGKLRRVMVVECYHLDKGQWYRSVFCALGMLEHGVSAYKDDRGQTRCPIVAGSCFVSRENTRYGIVRDMRPIQDEINSRRSKLLHELNVRQVQNTDSSAPPVDVETVRREAAKPDGVIPQGWIVVPRTDVLQGQAELLSESKSEIERMGPNPGILGRQGADSSGRAVQLRQQAGLTELQRVLGRFTDWELRCFRAMWATSRQFWSAPKWIRVTGDEEAPKYIQINQIVAPGQPATGPDGQAIVNPQTGEPVWAIPPQIENHMAEMDVDIIVETVPDTASLQQEVFVEFMRLAQSSPQMQQELTPELLIEMSSLPRKRQLLDKIKKYREEGAAQRAPAEAAAKQKLMAENIKVESEAVKNFATAKNQQITGVASAVKAHIDIVTAETIADQGIPGPQGQMPGQPVAPIQ